MDKKSSSTLNYIFIFILCIVVAIALFLSYQLGISSQSESLKSKDSLITELQTTNNALASVETDTVTREDYNKLVEEYNKLVNQYNAKPTYVPTTRTAPRTSVNCTTNSYSSTTYTNCY